MKKQNIESNFSKLFSMIFFWRSKSLRDHKIKINDLFVQTIMVGLFALMIFFILSNYAANIERRNISIGFGFLRNTASFSIGQTLIDYDPSDSYFKVYVVGLLNTLLASAIAIIVATTIGGFFGLFLLSKNILLRKVSEWVIEILRNLPPLLHVLFWYVVVVQRILPDYENAYSLFNVVYLSIKGLTVPAFSFYSEGLFSSLLLLFSVLAIVFVYFYSRKRILQGRSIKVFWLNMLICFVIILILVFLRPFNVEVPVRGKFRFETGSTLFPELFALVAALAIYTSGYIAIIVRTSIMSIPKNQIESAHSLGLNYFQRIRYVTVPLALRSLIPPLTNQYLNIIKNSSLASAVGYSDIVAVFAGTALNQSGRALEIMSMVMLTYFIISAVTSFLLNTYNKSILKIG